MKHGWIKVPKTDCEIHILTLLAWAIGLTAYLWVPPLVRWLLED